MAKTILPGEDNYIGPGTLYLNSLQTMPDGKQYSAIWFPVWNVYLTPEKIDEILKANRQPKTSDWWWHALWKSNIEFTVSGNRVLDWESNMFPEDDTFVYVPWNIVSQMIWENKDNLNLNKKRK